MERQDPAGDLEAEGIPELEDPPPGMEGTGGDYEAMGAPRDQPLASADYGTTAREQRVPEPEEIRRRREVPDRLTGGRDQPTVGRLVEDDEPADAGLEVAEATDDTLGLSAEEAAMHIIPE
jgi:hypothetical protein